MPIIQNEINKTTSPGTVTGNRPIRGVYGGARQSLNEYRNAGESTDPTGRADSSNATEVARGSRGTVTGNQAGTPGAMHPAFRRGGRTGTAGSTTNVTRGRTGDLPTDPMTRQVGERETVESRLTNVLQGDSPYVEQAQKDAQRMAASRGMGNTTMAAAAGQGAAIRAALPIAQQDARTETEQERLNQNTINKFRENQQSFGFNQRLSAQEAAQTRRLSGQESTQRINETASKYANEAELDELNHVLKFENDQWTKDFQNEINSVESNNNISEMSKEAYLRGQMQFMRDASQQIGDLSTSGLDTGAFNAARNNIIINRDANMRAVTGLVNEAAGWDWGGVTPELAGGEKYRNMGSYMQGPNAPE